MHSKAIIGLLFFCTLYIPSETLGVSGKLDFGDESSLRHESFPYKVNIPVRYKSIKTLEPKKSEDFDGIGVVCVSGGCNTTKSIDASDGSIKTDVVVHIQTNVDLKSNSSEKIEDTPDVPIVIGYAGTDVDSTSGIETPPFVVNDGVEPLSQPEFVPSNNPYGSGLSTSVYPSVGSLYSTNINRRLNVNNGIDNSFSTGRQSAIPSTFYSTSTAIPDIPRVDININSVPEVTVTTSDNTRNHVKNINYKTNILEMQVPYFEPSFHSHYYGEHPPPQFVWYPKKNENTINPVEFRNIQKPAGWTPSTWGMKTPLYPPYQHRHTGTTTTCREIQAPGLKWYPHRRIGIQNADPGSQINDKLAPLNR